jgi:hypothetical protein
VSPALHSRKLIAIVCLAVLLLAVLTPSAYGFVQAILAPFWLLIEILAIVSVQRATEDHDPYPFLFVSAVAPRAPPTQ